MLTDLKMLLRKFVQANHVLFSAHFPNEINTKSSEHLSIGERFITIKNPVNVANKPTFKVLSKRKYSRYENSCLYFECFKSHF